MGKGGKGKAKAKAKGGNVVTKSAADQNVAAPQERRLPVETAKRLEEQGNADWGEVTSVRVEEEEGADPRRSARAESVASLAELQSEARRLRSEVRSFVRCHVSIALAAHVRLAGCLWQSNVVYDDFEMPVERPAEKEKPLESGRESLGSRMREALFSMPLCAAARAKPVAA